MAAATLRGAAVRAQPTRPPNVLLLLASGWRGQTLPFAGDRALEAPNLSRLAKEGVWFRRAYSVNPETWPARAALSTGRYPHMSGVLDNQDRLDPREVTLASVFRGAGYEIGRFDADDLDSAVDFLRAGRDAPFYACKMWDAPREGAGAEAEWLEKYDPKRFRLRFNVPAARARRERERWMRYYAACSTVDAEVGRLLDALAEAGSEGRTIVLFTSDHGELLGSHGESGAGEAYEESLRVPLLIRYPGVIEPGTAVDMPVAGVDVAPTLLSLAGVSEALDMQGRDLLSGGRSESVYCQGHLGTPREWRAVIRGLDKVVVDRDLRLTHLYNLGQDPYEMENLVADKDRRRKRDEMSAILQDWMKRASDRILPSGLRLRE